MAVPQPDLDDLRRRLDRLVCLHPHTKALVLSQAQSSSADELRDYLDRRIAFLERYFAPIDDPYFLHLCAALNQLQNPQEVLTRLGLDAAFQSEDWLSYAIGQQFAPRACLYCLANHGGLAFWQLPGDVEAFSVLLLGGNLPFVGRAQVAVAVLEGFAGLGEADYCHRETLHRTLRMFQRRLKLTGDTTADYVQRLADGLVFLSRSEEAIATFEALAGLSEADYADPTKLGEKLRQFQRKLQLTGRNTADYIRAMGNALGFVSRPDDACRVLEGFPGLTEPDYADRVVLGTKLRQFQRDLQLEGNDAGAYVRTLAEALLFVNRQQHAALVVEAFAGLAEADYTDQVTLCTKLRELKSHMKLAGTTPANYVRTLGETLRSVNRPDDACRALEGFAGLAEADYADQSTLRAKLHQFQNQNQLEGNGASSYIRILADALTFASRHAHAALILEGFMGLAETDYADRALLGAKLYEFQHDLQLEGNSACSYVQGLAETLGFVGRPGDAALILEGFAGLTKADYAHRATVGAKLRQLQRDLQLEGNTAANYVHTLADALRMVSRPADAAQALVEFAGLAEADYAERATLGARLHQFKDDLKLTNNNAAGYVECLANALRFASRASHGAWALEGFAGLNEGDYADQATLGAKLNEFQCNLQLQGNNAANYICVLADALCMVSRQNDACRALEGFVGLTEADYVNQAMLGTKLRNFQGQLQLTDNNAVCYLLSLADALFLVGRRHHAVDVLIAPDPQFRFLTDSQLVVPPESGCPLMATLFEMIVDDPGWLDLLWELSRRVVSYTLRGLHRSAVRAEERARFVGRLSRLREQVVHIGWQAAARERVAAQAEANRRLALRWDAELGQRLLLEKFLLGQMEKIGHDGAAPPVRAFPFASPPSYWTASWPPDWSGHRPLRGVADPVCNLAFETRPSAETKAPEIQVVTVTHRPDWLAAIEADVLRGVEEMTLARALGPGTLLLRTGFERDGRLHWSAWRSDGEHLELSGHGTGRTENDHDRLAATVARHDLRIALAYMNPDRRKKALETIDKYRDLSDLHDVLSFSNVEGLLGRLGTVAERFREVGLSVDPLIDPPEDTQQLPRWLDRFVASWSGLQQDLAALPEGFPLAINWATAQFLEEVHGIWSFDELANVLTEDLDVVVQVDDVLHGVPIPHLPVNGRPLWTQVRSTRNSLSPLMDLVQGRIEQENPPRPVAGNRIQCISWFAPDDDAGQGAVELHHGQMHLAKDYELTYHGAAVSPAGGTTTLLKGVAAGPLVSLTACGHGVEHQNAVRLADMDWQGGGGDLSQVEWLLLPTCSIGRVRSSGVRDVEGFSVQLALHRCRAVLAARWPVQCQMAPETANEVLAQYLRLRQEFDAGEHGPELTQARLRARALNAARKVLLGPDGGGDFLNTVAAFDLWGLA